MTALVTNFGRVLAQKISKPVWLSGYCFDDNEQITHLLDQCPVLHPETVKVQHEYEALDELKRLNSSYSPLGLKKRKKRRKSISNKNRKRRRK